MPSIVANRIRLTRSTPPGKAATGVQRPAAYRAAIRLFEEMMEAATAAGPMARALPLFYAVSAAGRAIVAAHGRQVWSGKSHGLGQGTIRKPVTRSTVVPRKDGLFNEVMRTVGSGELSGEVELGALWSAIPDLFDTPLPARHWPSALFVWPRSYHQESPSLRAFAESKASVVIPEGAGAPTGRNAGKTWRRFFDQYPQAHGLSFDSPPGVPLAVYMTPRGWGIAVSWLAPEGVLEPVRVVKRVPMHRFHGDHWLIPRVGKNEDELIPLALWWVLLFGFSILARYEPTAWNAALDPDQSELSVRIEDALEVALVAVPHLLLEALLGEQFLLPRSAG